MHLKTFFKLSLILSLIFTIQSCDDDFIETGGSLINNLELPPLYETDQLVTYSKRVNRVQTNNLNLHTLADFQDPVFGNFKSSLLTQVSLNNTNNDFGQDPQLDSVVLTLPLLSREVNPGEYELDSISGSGDFFIKIFKSNHLLRNINPGEDGDFTENQIYYSDDFSTFQPNIESEAMAEAGPFNLSDFTESIELIQRSGAETIDTLSLSPRIRIKLPNAVFEEAILNKIGEPELASNPNFTNFFRGIHIVLEKADGEGVSALFNLQNEDANITLHYQTKRPRLVLNPEEFDEELDEFENVWNRYRLNFGNIRVSLFEDDFQIDTSSPNTQEGEENIFLRGGAGYYGVVELFTGPDSNGDGISDELQDLRDRNLLVNEANLEFFVNEDLANSSDNRVNRIIVFNLDNNTILQDYVNDRTAGETPSSSRISHLGPLTNTEDQGRKYRIRITDHINQVITQDSTNVKLGLMVTDNVNSTFQLRAETADNEISRIFAQTVRFTKGTVLHGNNSADEEKRVKLKLQLTEIN